MFRDVYNVTITDQWPSEGFELDVEFPIVIDELAAQNFYCTIIRSGEKFEKNATAIPRQSGYLETARAMYEYAYYKDDEVAQARGMSTSVGTLPILQEANYLRITSSFIVCVLLYDKVQKEYFILALLSAVAIVAPFLYWLNLSTKAKSE